MWRTLCSRIPSRAATSFTEAAAFMAVTAIKRRSLSFKRINGFMRQISRLCSCWSIAKVATLRNRGEAREGLSRWGDDSRLRGFESKVASIPRFILCRTGNRFFCVKVLHEGQRRYSHKHVLSVRSRRVADYPGMRGASHSPLGSILKLLRFRFF